MSHLPEKRRCTVCGSTRNEDGVCPLIGCKDPTYDNRVQRSNSVDQDVAARAQANGIPTFTISGGEMTGPSTVCEWIKQNILTAPPDKLRAALETAILMKQYPRRKLAD